MEKIENGSIALKQQLDNLRKQTNELDQLLTHFGVSLTDLPTSIEKELEEYAKLKLRAGLVDMDMNFLQEWYCTKAAENIPKKIAVMRLQNDIRSAEEELNKTERGLKETKSFLNEVCRITKSDEEMEQLYEEKNRELELLAERKNKLHRVNSYDMDDIIRKVRTITK